MLRQYQIDLYDQEWNDITSFSSEFIPRIWDTITVYRKEMDDSSTTSWPFKVIDVEIFYKRYPRIVETIQTFAITVDIFKS